MRVNGKQVELKESLVLDKFLESNGYALTKVAVELNGKIVPRKEYAATILEDTDALEIVCFVGGG
ncbi:MAG: sulfur carrier protein ThiS [Phascolarctobacterium sp.]|nr:sulfur carrier protein ThiS [Phascolarctobacterium sp.]